MPVSYAKNKVHIYKYIDNNRAKWNQYQAEYKKKQYNYNKEVNRLMNILLPPIETLI